MRSHIIAIMDLLFSEIGFYYETVAINFHDCEDNFGAGLFYLKRTRLCPPSQIGGFTHKKFH